MKMTVTQLSWSDLVGETIKKVTGNRVGTAIVLFTESDRRITITVRSAFEDSNEATLDIEEVVFA